jgi:hypothetical protein
MSNAQHVKIPLHRPHQNSPQSTRQQVQDGAYGSVLQTFWLPELHQMI